MDPASEIPEWAVRVATQLTDLGPGLSTHIMAALLRFGIPPEGIEAPAQATDFARMMVHRGAGLPPLLRCYHVGQAKLWRQWVDVVFADVHDPDELKRLVTWSTD
jgi:hypothetical protein